MSSGCHNSRTRLPFGTLYYTDSYSHSFIILNYEQYTQYQEDTSQTLGIKGDCYMQVYLSGNNVPIVKPPPNHISLSSMAAISFTTCLMAVLQPSRYSIFHGGDILIQLGLP